MTDDPGIKFSQDVKAAMKTAGVTQVQLAAMTGIQQTHLSRLLSGERGWKPINMEKVCRALNVQPLRYLADDVMRVPLLGSIALGSFRPDPNPSKVSRTISARMPAVLEEAYCLEVSDKSLGPFIKKGAYIYAQANPAKIEDGDLVVYLDPTGVGRVYLFIGNHQNVQLRSLGSDYPDLQLPLKHIAILDRVVAVFWP
jgi:transcriptional regulator with XRE-family HTH domain